MGTGDGGGKKLLEDGVGEFLPELGVDWEIEPLVPLFLQNLRMFLTLTIEVLRNRESFPGTRLLELWSSEVESRENLLDGVLSSLMIVEIEDFSALWVGRVDISGTAGTGGTSSNGTNDEGYLPNGSGESGMTGDSRDRGGWRGGYRVSSSSLCVASDSSETNGDEPFLLDNSFGGWIVTPFSAHCGWFAGSASDWGSNANVE